MNNLYRHAWPIGLATAVLAVSAAHMTTVEAAPPAPYPFTWRTVVNNNDFMPTDTCDPADPSAPPICRHFNSYNQPSVNIDGLVVIRARSKGGGGGEGGEGGGGGQGGGGSGGEGHQPIHGIYTRDMGVAGSPVVRILDRTVEVPQPNNAHYPPSNPSLTTFIETPSFPRIDMWSDTIATRANHQPVWEYLLPDGSETRAGTTGIYTNPFGALITGASKLGAVPDFEVFAVPGLEPPTMFDVFPGAPAVTGETTLVFKGNFTVEGVGKTGVFYRELYEEDINGGAGGGINPVVLIANNTETVIPGTNQLFGSTSPPSAANGLAVFAGFDNEEYPTLGGIYLAELVEMPELAELVSIGDWVPGENPQARFSRLGEGVAFDGRYVAFWGAWGPASRTIRLHCPTEGNRDRIAFCLTQCPEPAGCATKLPVRQGIFLHDTLMDETHAVAKAPNNFEDFVFWNFSGRVPGIGGGDEGGEDDGEPARWRSSAFIAVSGTSTAFKAVTGNRVGVYLSEGPGEAPVTVLDNRTESWLLDDDAPLGSTVVEVGLEREGLRGDWLAVSAKMAVEGGTEEDGMAGVYITKVSRAD
jgi:hypothetical protein